MEYGSIEREIHVAASPEVVFEVLSSPEHLREWWPDEAHLEPVPGSVGELVFGDRAGGDATVVPITVLEVEPPRRFSFRWTHGPGEVAAEGNSLLVTFDLVPSTDGTTTVRMSETGFRERGWEVAVLEEQYREHGVGWDHYLPVLDGYLARLVDTR